MSNIKDDDKPLDVCVPLDNPNAVTSNPVVTGTAATELAPELKMAATVASPELKESLIGEDFIEPDVALTSEIEVSAATVEAVAVADEPHEKTPPTSVLKTNPNVTMRRSPCSGKKTGKPCSESLNLPTTHLEDLIARVRNAPLSEMAKNKATSNWAYGMDAALNMQTTNKSFINSLHREGSKWDQVVDYEGQSLFGSIPKMHASDLGEVISGDRAIMAMTTQLGMGGHYQFPLWHSGIWLNIRSPLNGAILELDRRIASERVSLGRRTRGLIYAEDSVFTKEAILDFILDLVYDCNVKDWNTDLLKELILSTDINPSIAGLAGSMYPNGYPLSRSCTANVDRCQHVSEDTVNVTRMIWTDRSRLEPRHLKHMSKRRYKYTVEEIKAYQDSEFNRRSDVKIETSVGDDFSEGEDIMHYFKVDIQVPSIKEYFDSGNDWISNIEADTDAAFTIPLKNSQRADYIINQGKASVLRQYASWINAMYVVTPTDSVKIEDRDTISRMCVQFSGQELTVDNMLREISNTIDLTTISIFGIPDYECPACNNNQNNKNRVNPEIIPMDPESIFFTLYTQKLQHVLVNRNM